MPAHRDLAAPAGSGPGSAMATSVAARLLMASVRGYRLLLSPWLGSSCRFEPTCSVYALGALQQHGAARGSVLSAWRIARCHPWCAGGHDPVPPAGGGLFSALLARAAAQPAADAAQGASELSPELRKTSV